MTEAAAASKTPLYALHVELGGKMVPFAGYALPVQYPGGIIKEHNHTREQASLFDVSHMGQVRLHGADAAAALETLVPIDVLGLGPGQQRYGLFINERGGIMDDLMVTNAGDHILVIVNAACKQQDIAHMRANLAGRCELEVLEDRALLAIQGPQAGAVMKRLAPETAEMLFMNAGEINVGGIECFAGRAGYTGEDGFEISVSAERASELASLLLEQPEVAPAGLGARDSLRLEAGLCLYGHDLDSDTTPVEGSLLWALSKVRRADGERPGGYPGDAIVFDQIANGVARKRVGILPLGRAPVREGAELVNSEGRAVGRVTSGCFGPTLGAPVAMGYVEFGLHKSGTELNAMVRGKPQPVKVAKTPFVEQRYYRGGG